MAPKTYRVREVARVTGLTVRTLHHYDAIGLLSPARTPAGYRAYTDSDLLLLQQILIYRELGFALEQIKQIVHDPGFDRRAALVQQRRQLAARVAHTQTILRAVDAALATLQGNAAMDTKQIFAGFDPAAYEHEVKQRWGETEAYRESARRTQNYSQSDWQRIKHEHDDLMQQLAAVLARSERANAPSAMDLAEQLRLHIDRYYYPCSHAMHTKLAEMYTGDSRFETNLNRYGDGVAGFLAAAIKANAARADRSH